MPSLLIELFYIAIPVVRTDSLSGGRSVGVRSRDDQIFSDGEITSFYYPWCSAGALHARELRYNGANLLAFTKARECMIANVACVQTLFLGESREVTRKPHAKGDVSARGREILLFPLPSRSRLFLWLASIATRNLESLSLSKKI